MTAMTQCGARNLVLAGLAARDLDILFRHLRPLDLSVACDLARRGEAGLLFIESGIALATRRLMSGRTLAVEWLGREAIIDARPVKGAAAQPEHRALVDGAVLELPPERTEEFVTALPTLGDGLLRSLRASASQRSELLMRAALGTVEMRLAHCLLICAERIDGNEIAVTHGALADALGVRRASITDTLHVLEGDYVIRSMRSRIIVRDLDRLAAVASGRERAAAAPARTPYAMRISLAEEHHSRRPT
jgi:CRP-like cAMP-binding protein